MQHWSSISSQYPRVQLSFPSSFLFLKSPHPSIPLTQVQSAKRPSFFGLQSPVFRPFFSHPSSVIPHPNKPSCPAGLNAFRSYSGIVLPDKYFFFDWVNIPRMTSAMGPSPFILLPHSVSFTFPPCKDSI